MTFASRITLLLLVVGLLLQDSPLRLTSALGQAMQPNAGKKKSTADGPVTAPAPKTKQPIRVFAKSAATGPAANDFWWLENNSGAAHLFGNEGRIIYKPTADLILLFESDGALNEPLSLPIPGWVYKNDGADYWMFFSAVPTPYCNYLQKEVLDSFDQAVDNKQFNHFACAD